MKTLATLFLLSVLAGAQPTHFDRIVILVQENRSPDNLFQGLCSVPYGSPGSCSTTPAGNQYNIQTGNWADNTSTTGVIQPVPVPMAALYDNGHSHATWLNQCHKNAAGQCQMDGAALVDCKPIQNCPASGRSAFGYVDNSTGILDPYLDMATQYGFGNYFFQTNQGPSFPAHQYLFGATSSLSAADDALGNFMAENSPLQNTNVSCNSTAATTVAQIDSSGSESKKVYPCAERQTLGDSLRIAHYSWGYYTYGLGSKPSPYDIWTAPAAIAHICQSNGSDCVGDGWKQHVHTDNTQVLTDIANCNLRHVSWVMPSGGNSDHSGDNTGGGPAWVASVVNAIGATSGTACDYWSDTAIIVLWDDWGGWYDHEPPHIQSFPYANYEGGFRVPLLFISAYTPQQTVSNQSCDFGCVANFVEQNFNLPTLGFADARAGTAALSEYYNLSLTPRPYLFIGSPNKGNPDIPVSGDLDDDGD